MSQTVTEEYNKKLDVLVNGLNIGLIVLAGVCISFGIYYITQTAYTYLINTGLILLVCGIVAIIPGGWGFYKHYKMIKTMKRRARMDLNY